MINGISEDIYIINAMSLKFHASMLHEPISYDDFITREADNSGQNIIYHAIISCRCSGDGSSYSTTSIYAGNSLVLDLAL